MTAHALKGDQDKCLDAGMNDYTTKPIQIKQRAPVIEKHRRDGQAAPGAGEIKLEIQKPTNGEGTFGRHVLLDRVGGNLELCRKIWKTFLETMRDDMKTLGNVVAAQDAEQIRMQAHKLKGGCAEIGAPRMREYAARLEQMGKNNDLADSRELLDGLREEFGRVSEMIYKELQHEHSCG